jgi:hypothetical protein
LKRFVPSADDQHSVRVLRILKRLSIQQVSRRVILRQRFETAFGFASIGIVIVSASSLSSAVMPFNWTPAGTAVAAGFLLLRKSNWTQ